MHGLRVPSRRRFFGAFCGALLATPAMARKYCMPRPKDTATPAGKCSPRERSSLKGANVGIGATAPSARLEIRGHGKEAPTWYPDN